MSTAKPHILVFVDWYLPGYRGGGPITSVANLVATLGGEFAFSIVTSDRDHGDAQPYEGVPLDQWVEMGPDCRVWYCSRSADGYRNIRGLVGETEYALLYLNSMFSLRYTIFPLWSSRAAKPETPVLLAPRGMLHAGALGLKSMKKKVFLGLLKASGIPRQIHFHATDAQEVSDIRAVFGADTQVVEAPNLPRMAQSPWVGLAKEPGRLRMVYLSRLSEKKGLHTLLALLQGCKSQVELDIVGPDEEQGYWQRCAALAAQLPAHVQVRKHDAAPPAEAMAFLQRAHCFVMPTMGENFGHAIFESFCAGRPVVISDRTPWRGLEAAKLGFDLPLDAPQGILEAIERLAGMGQGEWESWAKACWDFAARHIASDESGQAVARMFRGLLDVPTEKRQGK